MTKSVPERLRDQALLYEERDKVYGSNYKDHGNVMASFFPEGVKLLFPMDYNRYSCFKEIATRLGRYARNFNKGGHADSLNDIAVYAQMLQELDATILHTDDEDNPHIKLDMWLKKTFKREEIEDERQIRSEPGLSGDNEGTP